MQHKVISGQMWPFRQFYQRYAQWNWAPQRVEIRRHIIIESLDKPFTWRKGFQDIATVPREVDGIQFLVWVSLIEVK